MEVAASGPDALWLALKQAQAGDAIVLAPGQYGDFSFFALNFAGEPVSIRSADPFNPAVFTRLNLDHSSGLSFSGLEVVTIGGTAVNVQHSARIAFADMDIHGAARGVGNAVIIRDSTEVSLVRSQIHDVGTGVSFLGGGSGLELAENVFRDVANGDIRGAGPAVSVYGNVHAKDPTVAPAGGGGELAPMLEVLRGDEPVVVTSSDALWTALKSAKTGDTILLKEGVYTPVTLNLFKFEGAGVTIRSVDPAHEAVLNGLKITNSSGLTFKDVEINVIGGSTGVQVMTSKEIHFEGLNVHGAGLRNGSGIQVRASTDVSITNSDLHNLGLGVSHSEAGNLLVANNSFSNLQSDGVTGGSSSRVTVTGNTFTSFVPKEGDHPDAIQFWGSVSGVATDIVITNNVIQRGDGQVIQGIFLQDIQNVTITGNAMSGTMFNGISLSNVKTALVQDNFVQGYTDMPTRIIVRKGSTDVTVNDNTTQQLADYHDAGPNPRYSATNNTIVGPANVGDTTMLKSWLAAHDGLAIKTGDAEGNLILGTAGNDLIDGRAGGDTMTGGYGNDTYVVDDARDVVVELAVGGVDTVKTALSSYTLGGSVENLTLTGTTVQGGAGNGLANVMRSNTVGANLNAGAGADTLVSVGGGADRFTGGAGNDVFRFEKLPTSVAQVTDFTRGQDILDLRPLLSDYKGANPIADGWVKMQVDAKGVTIMVDADGAAGPAGFTSVAKLAGVASLTASDWIF